MNKQYIVDEIIRTAKENGGVPVGHRRFYSETGIKYSDVIRTDDPVGIEAYWQAIRVKATKWRVV